eukprot:1159877-Pelagomonas_calceolata.AAC.20
MIQDRQASQNQHVHGLGYKGYKGKRPQSRRAGHEGVSSIESYNLEQCSIAILASERRSALKDSTSFLFFGRSSPGIHKLPLCP